MYSDYARRIIDIMCRKGWLAGWYSIFLTKRLMHDVSVLCQKKNLALTFWDL